MSYFYINTSKRASFEGFFRRYLGRRMYRSSSKCLQYQAHFENKSDIPGKGCCSRNFSGNSRDPGMYFVITKACSRIFIQSKEQSIVKIFQSHTPPLFLYFKVSFEHPYVGSPINLAEWSGNVALFSPDGSWIGMTTACFANRIE